eukprot:Gregarina_sp_Poly_1__4698@NODE_250_length_10686_cov_97_967134_g219_i0_p1_GENE_NODE_250_length_10686_cov_97_967134_g219_i0NODE_250_length_10686_cov_97_967134_g219_i0_p1_ORF_typecomplete_len1339_score311_13SMC_N/PF02463_19/1_5e46SMC_N/PF02463_19/2e03SMC_N/PF02463_19/1_3e57AAA_15/PF13175_6/0_0021AAA_23/PF13476_6/1_2e14AAA_23/PF13476_6/2_2e03AAA_21/PF13304_6/0_00037AAA_21/PF13304_6/0_0021AAA_29/PF13555_6/6_1e08SMC_hinge/PF06470_13/4_5e03SMC_hinge/PF06470_13/2e06DUF2813/PF11398_8/1_1e06DUF2813/PF1139
MVDEGGIGTSQLCGIQRLMLDRIVLQNFKSYAGEVTVGPFHQHFSVIVGPNGSGKSNIIDALLFVFGRRAAQLRQKKIVDLIHSSDLDKPNWAKVSVFMAYISEQSGDRCPSKHDAFCVSRDVHRDGSSKYQLDGRTVTHNEMVEFLKSQQIDLEHNRFLILQGEVEQMSTMPPMGKKEGEIGFLEILEDLIGSNAFLPKISEAQTELEEAQKTEAEWRRRYNLSRNEIDALTGPCFKAFQIVKHQKKLLVADAKLKAKTIAENQIASDITRTKLEEKEEQLLRLQEQKETELAELKELERQIKVEEDRLKEGERLFSELRQEMESCNIEDGKQRESIKLLKKQISTREQQLRQLEQESKQLQQDAKLTLLEATKRKAELPSLEANLEKTTAVLDSLNVSLEKEYKEAAEQKLSQDKLVEEVAVVLQALRKQRIALQSQVDVLETSMNSAAERVKQLKAKVANKNGELSVEKQNLQKSEAQLTVARQSQASAQAMVQEHLQERTRLQEELEVIISEQSKQHDGRSGMNAMVRLYHELQDAMKPNGRLEGMGTFLLDMGKIDIAKYGVAFSVAGCGGELAVCPNETAATKIIDYVKVKQLGRIDCAVLPKMRARWKNDYLNWKKKIEGGQFPKGSAPLISLVKDADEDAMIMYFTRVRDTVLVEGSLDDARRVHRDGDSRWRVVTLKGELIEKFGTMTGGKASNYLEDRKHKQKSVDENEMRSLRQHRQELETRLSSMQHSWTDKTRTLDRLTEQVKRFEKELEYEKGKLEQMQTEIYHYEELLLTLEKEAKATSNEIQMKDLEKLRERLSSVNEEEAEMTREFEKRKSVAQKIDAKIANIGGREKLKLEEAKKSLAASVNKSKDILNNADCDAAEKIKKSEIIQSSKIPNTQEEIKRIENEIQEKDRRIDALEDRARPLLAEYENIEKMIEGIKKSHKKLRKDCAEKEASIRTHSSVLIPIQNEAADLENHLGKLKRLIAEAETSIESLRNDFNELPDFDAELLESLISETNHQNKKPQEEPSITKTEPLIKQELTESGEPIVNESDLLDPEGDVQVDDERSSVAPYRRSKGHVDKIDFPETFVDLDKTPLSEFQLEVHRCEEIVARFNKKENFQDLKVLAQFMEKSKATKSIEAELNSRTAAVNALVARIDSFVQQRCAMFSSGFLQISIKLKELYQMLTLGGDAELEYRDPSDPFKEGIEFSVRPPGKSWRIIQNLSGGEKTLSSLALIFALHHFKPTPIYFLDEIDAALDPQNVVIIASYVAEEYRNGGAQFVVISLRNQFFERADRLIGVYKVKDRTQTCVIDPARLAAPEPEVLDRKRRRSEASEAGTRVPTL